MDPLFYDNVLESLAEGKILVTVNGRLRDKLAWRYAEQQAIGGVKKTWVKPQIVTLEEKITEMWQAYELKTQMPTLLTKEQERALWTEILQTQYPEGFIQLSKIVGLAMQAWRTLHLWNMPDYFETDLVYFQGSEDAKKFILWSKLFKETLNQRQFVTLCERVGYFLTLSEWLPLVLSKASWVLIGFDDLPPLYEAWIKVIQHKITQVHQVNLHNPEAVVHQLSFRSVTEEFEVAARWAKALVQKGDNNIGIVHPELAMHRHKIEEVFLNVFHPEKINCAQKIVSGDFTLSAGTPLGSQCLVKTALRLLRLIQSHYGVSEIDFILRHGYIGKNISQSTENIKIITLLKKTDCTVWSLQALLNWLSVHTESDYLLTLFQGIEQATKTHSSLNERMKVKDFISRIQGYFELFDFPGERVLSSLEYQTLARFYRAMTLFGQLALVLDQKKYSDYLTDFETYLNYIPFQAESGEVPVNVMGVLEASGQLFSHLWVMGMNNQNWPASPEPNPFIPYELQREKNMPHASPEREYDLASKITKRLTYSANQVIFSYSQYEEEKACLPSDCIKSIDSIALGSIEQSQLLPVVQEINTELFEDSQAPKVTSAEKISGGSSILKAQAACPFKAFSEGRLNLKKEVHQQKVLGLSAMERGIIVHDVLDKLWGQLKNHQTLCSYSDSALSQLVQQKLCGAILSFREKDPSRLGEVFWKNEQINLHKVLLKWLALEKARAPFEVHLRESWQKITLEGLSLNLRIDRIDLTESKEAILIDYKTGEMSFSNCFGERLNEPQLPIYCLLEQAYTPKGVAFGLVKPTGECHFIGITYSEEILPEVHSVEKQKNYLAKLGVDCQTKLAGADIWQALLTYWQHNLANLAKAFMSGEASVSPKAFPQTCRYCHLMSLCRIHEKITS